MFFIGGLNSVLPYIIYLSLLWVFMLVGFSGKLLQVRQYLNPQTYYSDNTSLKEIDSKVFYYYNNTTVSKNLKISTSQAFYAWKYHSPDAVISKTVVGLSGSSFDSQYYCAFGFRGPPAI